MRARAISMARFCPENLRHKQETFLKLPVNSEVGTRNTPASSVAMPVPGKTFITQTVGVIHISLHNLDPCSRIHTRSHFISEGVLPKRWISTGEMSLRTLQMCSQA